jgi:hypothetical protein
MKVIWTLLVALALGTVIGASPAMATTSTGSVVIPDDGDLTISWRCRAFSAEIRYRLYTFEADGSPRLLTERTARPGTESYSYVDSRARLGGPVAYRLVAVLPNGDERVLATTVCFEPDMNDTGTAPSSAPTPEPAFDIMEAVPPASPIAPALRPTDAVATGVRPNPEVPPPRAHLV